MFYKECVKLNIHVLSGICNNPGNTDQVKYKLDSFYNEKLKYPPFILNK